MAEENRHDQDLYHDRAQSPYHQQPQSPTYHQQPQSPPYNQQAHSPYQQYHEPQYQPTPPTPQSQFSSQHTTPHMSFSPILGGLGADARYSLLYPVYPDQERAMSNEEEIHYRENRGTIQSIGMDSLTTVQEDDTHKEVIEQKYPYKEMVTPAQPHYSSPDIGMYYASTPEPHLHDEDVTVVDSITGSRPRKRKVFGFIPVWACVVVIVAVLIAVGVGVGLTFGLKKKSSTSKALTQTEPGAFHGSGFATAVTGGSYGQLLLFFQHSTGQIRQMLRGNDGTWTGGEGNNVVTSDAKNGTPISIVTFQVAENPQWHLFYIDRSNTIREKITSNNGTTWTDGTIKNLGLLAMDDPNASLQACYANYFGSPDQVVPTTGLTLFYASDANTHHRVEWTVNGTDWTPKENYTANGRAGLACYTWGPDSLWYIMYLDLDNGVKIAWRDAKEQQNGGNWMNTSIVLTDAMTNSSMGYTEYFFVQLQDGNLQGYDIDFHGQDTNLNTADGSSGQISIDRKPIPGSHFAVTRLPAADGQGNLTVFAQDNMTNIVESVMDKGVGSWDYTVLPIPDS